MGALLAMSIISMFATMGIFIGDSVALGNENKTFPTIAVILILIFTLINIGALIPGIMGIKDSKKRGISIATTATAATALVFGFTFFICAIAFMIGAKQM